MCTTSCSTQQNTAKSRWWHAFNTRYNVYYNGTLAYIEGSLAKETGNKDNYTELIPLYTVGNKNSKELGKSDFDQAITKCEKAIQLHSIKRRPEWTKNRRKTAADIEWLNRKEYNPFLWKAWMLMGRSQFHSGDFDAAASTFSYMSHLYATQPAIYDKARAWLAKCYVEQNYLYEAEDVIRNIERDSIHWSAVKEWDYTYADYYIHKGDYQRAVPYLRKVIRHEMRRKQKAREWFLMGQLQAAVGNRQEAYKAYKHVVRLNPPYSLEFNARIAMTEVMAQGNSRKMIGRLKRMASSDKNSEYLEQVYYAIGNIHLAQKDTLQAIAAYERGNSKATRNGIEKGVLLLKLGDLYWEKEKFSDAQRCYGEAIGLLDKDRKDYNLLSERSKLLDELAPYTDAVRLQDSLQALARMSETERNAAIDRVIEALKKKEKEERNRQAEAHAQQQLAQNGGLSNLGNNSNSAQSNNATLSATSLSSTWYFYNPTAVAQGKAQFQRLWGKRENVDNWQRINKTVVGGITETPENVENAGVTAPAESPDSASNAPLPETDDPHQRAYYLAQIPFTDEQLAASNAVLKDGLYHAGVLFKDKFDNLSLSEKQLRRLTDHYPDYDRMDDVYYHLYLLYNRKGEVAKADSYLQKLKESYPESQWTTLLSDPYYQENARFGDHIEDSLYAATYDAFKASRYQEVKGNTAVSSDRFPNGANRNKFLFIGGLAKLNDGDAAGCITDMKTVVEKYPEGRIAEMAGMIINGVNAGKRLHGGKFDLEDVWNRRSAVLNDSDSIQAKGFSEERNTNFVFMFVYHPDSIQENQLLFEMAKFNFTTYLVRNFDIDIEDFDGLHRMMFTGFRSYDEAVQYAHAVMQQEAITQILNTSVRAIIVSEGNLKLLGTYFSYQQYEDFYQKEFSTQKVAKEPLLEEPAEIVIEGDGTPEETPQQPTGTQPQESNEETEIVIEEPDDEYYELEGF